MTDGESEREREMRRTNKQKYETVVVWEINLSRQDATRERERAIERSHLIREGKGYGEREIEGEQTTRKKDERGRERESKGDR